MEWRADAGSRLDLAIDSTGFRLSKTSGAGHEGFGLPPEVWTDIVSPAQLGLALGGSTWP